MPLISEEVFLKVQKILESRGKRKQHTIPKQKVRDEFSLRGFLICPICKQNWTGSISQGNGGSYAYYHCQKGCRASVNALWANEVFLDYLRTLIPPLEVMQLYKILLAKMIETRIHGRDDHTSQLRKQIAGRESRLLKIDQKRFITEEINRDTYQRLKMHEEASKEAAMRKIHEIEMFSENVQQHCTFGMNFFTRMDLFFQNGSIEVKRKMIGSIFPGKLIFEEGKYRTGGMNPALSLILQKNNELRQKETGNTSFLENVSGDVPRIGLEPTHLSAPEPKSGVSTNFTIWA